MFKKLILLTATVLSLLSLPAQAWRNDEITMLVVPREVIPLQIAQDISRRYPVMLVSYQTVRDDLKIHAWNGDSWVPVSVEDYTNGTFFAVRPKHAIIVEDQKMPAPAVLVPSSSWCESANRLTSTDPRVMLHLLGIYFDFPFRHWNQFAKRYNYSIEEINPTLHNVHWWDLRADILIAKRANRNFSADLDNWYYLEPIPAPAIEPVVMDEEAPAPSEEPTGATTVDITAKAPEAPAKDAVVPVKPAPAVESAPAVTPEEPSTAAEPETVEPEPMVDTVASPEPVDLTVADPFSPLTFPRLKLSCRRNRKSTGGNFSNEQNVNFSEPSAGWVRDRSQAI